MLFSHLIYFPLAMLFAAITGFGTVSITTICNTIIQVESDGKMRGRVMSYVAMSMFGMLPLGSLLIGSVSQKIGAQNTMLCQGITAIFIGAVFSKFLRRDKINKENVEHIEEVEEIVIKEFN
jgi:MFS family permease